MKTPQPVEYFISENYKWKNFNDFQNFSNDILHDIRNKKIYKKMTLALCIYTILSILLIIGSIVWIIILQQVINKDIALSLGLGITFVSLGFTSYLVPIALVFHDSVTPKKSTPLQWKNYYNNCFFSGFRWIPLIRRWCPLGVFRTSLYQVLSIINKMDTDDQKFLFNFASNPKNFNLGNNPNEKWIGICKIRKNYKFSKAKLNIIFGLLNTLSYIDFKSSFIVDSNKKEYTDKKPSSWFWWASMINPTVLGIVSCLSTLTTILIGSLV